MRQVRQRIAVAFHLKPLTEVETSHYMSHRLELCGHFGKIDAEDRLGVRAKRDLEALVAQPAGEVGACPPLAIQQPERGFAAVARGCGRPGGGCGGPLS